MNEIQELERLIRLGHYAQARRHAEELLRASDALRIRQLYAFALSKSGLPEAARDYLEKVAKQHPDDPETNGILGGIYKELFRNQQSTSFAAMSRDTYDRNFAHTRSYYTGINAATMSTLAGQARRGKELAQEVLQLLTDPEHDFWEAATQAEAYLLLKDKSKSVEAYSRARRLAGSDWGKINSVYNQLWLLKHYLPVPREALSAFSPPVVVAFVGHMIDHPDRATRRFPESISADIRQSIISTLNTVNGRIGYSSLACGGDILFAEAMEELGGEVNIFLPFNQGDFIEASVAFAGDHWKERFLRLVGKYPVTYLTEEPHAGHADLFGLQTSIIFGLSHLRSVASHSEPILLSVLSERDQHRHAGGTRDTIGLWPNSQRHISINPDTYVPVAVNSASPQSVEAPQNRTDRPVLYFISIDLREDDPAGEATLSALATSSLAPVVTWLNGPTLVAGFRQLLGVLEFATHLLSESPPGHQQPARITLHAGPFALSRAETMDAYPKLSPDIESPIAVLEQLVALHRLTAPGTVGASGTLGALLALDTTRYKLTFVETLRDANGQPITPIDVYTLSFVNLARFPGA